MNTITTSTNKECRNCLHFYQHYILTNPGNYAPVFCGHCMCHVRKNGNIPQSRICENYIKATPNKVKKHKQEKLSKLINHIYSSLKHIDDYLKK